MTQLTARLNESHRDQPSAFSLYSTGAIRLTRVHGMVAAVICWVVITSAIHIRSASIWYDEAITLLTVSGHAQADFSQGMEQFKPGVDLRKIVIDLYQQDVHPPLYFWTLAIWRVIFGPSLEAARSLSALFVTATCLLLYQLARDSEVRWPWVPVAIYAVGAAGAQFAWNARPYAMASFLVLLTHQLARRRSRWTGICGAASIATHYFAALCVGPILLLMSIEEWKIHRIWVKQTALTFAIGAAPLLALLRIHLIARPHQFTGFGSLDHELWALLKGSIADALPNSSLPGWGFALIIAAAFAVAGMGWSWKRREYLVPLAYLGFLCGFLVLGVVTNKSIAKMPVDYYLGIAAPWLAMLVGFGVSAHPRWSPLLAVAAAAGMTTAAPLVTSINYRQLAARIRAECSECTVVVGNGYAGAVPACLLYESGGMKVITVNPDDDPQTITSRAGDQQPIAFVRTSEPPTARAEEDFLKAYPSVWRGGYFEVFTAGASRSATGSAEAKKLTGSSNRIRWE